MSLQLLVPLLHAPWSRYPRPPPATRPCVRRRSVAGSGPDRRTGRAPTSSREPRLARRALVDPAATVGEGAALIPAPQREAVSSTCQSLCGPDTAVGRDDLRDGPERSRAIERLVEVRDAVGVAERDPRSPRVVQGHDPAAAVCGFVSAGPGSPRLATNPGSSRNISSLAIQARTSAASDAASGPPRRAAPAPGEQPRSASPRRAIAMSHPPSDAPARASATRSPLAT